MIFAREKATQELFSQLIPLLREHYDEIAHPDFKEIQKLDPDFDFFLQADLAGMLRAFTIRENGEHKDPTFSGNLIGYWVLFVRKNIHYRDLIYAHGDVLFIKKDHRGIGQKFIPWVIDQLKSEGVHIMDAYMKKAHNFGPYLERLGFEQIELHYTKRLN